MFFFFFSESSQGSRSLQPTEIPGPWNIVGNLSNKHGEGYENVSEFPLLQTLSRLFHLV